MDVHQASISAAVGDDAGKLVMECVIKTTARTILYDLVKPHVAQVAVCDPRTKALLKAGNKDDRVDARKLSELLRAGLLTPVYHGDSGVRTLRELSRSYLTVTKDLIHVMNRTKALYRSWAIPVEGGAGCRANFSKSNSEANLFLLTSPFIERRRGKY